MANNIIKRVWNRNRIVQIEDLRGMVFQDENAGHTFRISGVDDDGNTVALSGTVAGVFLRPDNTDVAITGSASGGVVSVTLPANCYAVPGRFGLTIFVTSNSQKTAVYAAVGTVSRTSSGTVSPGTASDVVDLINQISLAVATIPASWSGLMADIAPTYSTSALYPVGSYCYYNGDLYRCTTAITTAETWTASHWTVAVLGNDLRDKISAEAAAREEADNDLKSALSNYERTTKNLLPLKNVSVTTPYSCSVKDNIFTISANAEGTKDITIPLSRNVVLPAGNYVLSFQGAFQSGSTINVFLHQTSGAYGTPYGISPSTGVSNFSLSESQTIDSIMMRVVNPAMTINAGLQLESGTSMTEFISPYSAKDVVLERQTDENISQIENELSDVHIYIKNESRDTKNLVKLAEINKSESGYSYSAENNHITITASSLTGNKDLTIPLAEPMTLEAGSYTISIQGAFEATSTTTFYLMSSGVSKGNLGLSANARYGTITINTACVIDSIMMRTSNLQNLSINADFQIESGTSMTEFISPYSAKDVVLENRIDKLSSHKIIPIFENCVLASGNINYEANIYNQWIATPQLMHILKGSTLKKINACYYQIAYFDSSLQYVGLITNLTQYIFEEDMYIRIAIRATDYANISPKFADEVLDFDLYSDTEYVREPKCTFFGLSKNATSGQSFLAKLPDGKNLLIDSHLLSYYTGFANALRSRGVRRIDYYVQTHYHADHMSILNILNYLPNRIDIEGATVFLPSTISETAIDSVGENHETLISRQNALLEYFESNNCTIIHPSEGEVYKIADDIYLLFYNCDHTVYNSQGEHTSANYNDWSLCCYVLYGLNAINISADIGPIGQGVVGGTLPKATILTAPHHGWDNGPNNLIPAFINNVNPDVVISTNGTEHSPSNTESPANIMLATSPMQSYCEANGVPNYPTFLNGPIEIELYKYGWKFGGAYTRFIRNGKNWKFNDNTDKQE